MKIQLRKTRSSAVANAARKPRVRTQGALEHLCTALSKCGALNRSRAASAEIFRANLVGNHPAISQQAALRALLRRNARGVAFTLIENQNVAGLTVKLAAQGLQR